MNPDLTHKVSRTGLRRLRKASNWIEERVEDEWFDMRYWWHQAGVPSEIAAIRAWRNHECGTAACFVGWAPAIFPRLVTLSSRSANLKIGEGRYRYPLDAARELFDLSEDQACDLFLPKTGNLKRCQVIRNVRKLCDAIERRHYS